MADDDTDLMLGCDWGTTTFRLRLARAGDGHVLAEHRRANGVADVAGAGPTGRAGRFRAILDSGIAALAGACGRSLDGIPVVVSGMASADIGWRPLPYATLPFDLTTAADVVVADVSDGQGPDSSDWPSNAAHPTRTLLVSGVRSDRDVMRGEETELIGLARLQPDVLDAGRWWVMLPGTHAKHARVEGGRLSDFRTFMTGELFAVLSRHSILRHAVAPLDASTGAGQDAGPAEGGPEAAAFRDGVREGLGGAVTAALFRTRTRRTLDNAPPAANAAFLSGVLIGAEIAALRAGLAPGDRVLLSANAALAGRYSEAFREAGLADRLTVVPPDVADRAAVAGQAVILKQFAMT